MLSARSLAFSLVAFLAAAPVFAADNPVDTSAYKKPIRVACLGDSITYGVGAGTGWGWPDQLDRMLGADWDVRNFGHSGATVGEADKHSIWHQKEYTEAMAFHPDVAIILLGTNDTKPTNWDDAGRKQFPKLYKKLIVEFQQLTSTPRVYCGLPPFVPGKGNFGINEEGVQQQIPIIQEICKDWKAGVIDVHGALVGKDKLFPDNVHPNKDGATLIAKTVYQSLTGKTYDQPIPGPADVKKDKLAIRAVENPGQMTYRETFGVIAALGMPADKLGPIKERFEVDSGAVDAKIANYESQIKQNEQLRSKYKHSKEEAEQKLYGEYRTKVKELVAELEKFKQQSNLDLITLVPSDYRDEFGTAWLAKYIADRLSPISITLTPEQRKTIQDICKQAGAAYGKINNTPERSIANVEAYRRVNAEVLNAEQKRRVNGE